MTVPTKSDNLDEMGQLLDKHELPTLTQKECKQNSPRFVHIE